jgi:hypothetical protein
MVLDNVNEDSPGLDAEDVADARERDKPWRNEDLGSQDNRTRSRRKNRLSSTCRYMEKIPLLVPRARRIVDVVVARLAIGSYVDVNEHISFSAAITTLTAMLAEGFVRFFLVAWAGLAAASSGGSKSRSMRSERGAWSTGSGAWVVVPSLVLARLSERREGSEILWRSTFALPLSDLCTVKCLVVSKRNERISKPKSRNAGARTLSLGTNDRSLGRL